MGKIINFFIICFILFIALIIRIKYILISDCWLDCSFSVLLSKFDLSYIISGIDVHPPFYYIILKGWYFIFGTSILNGRLLSVLLGTVFLLSLYYITNKLYNQKTAILTLFFATFSLTYIFYSIEIRMYMLLCVLILWAYYFFEKQKYIPSILCFVMAVYTHYYSVFFVLYILYKFCEGNRAKIFKYTSFAFILIIPLFFYFYQQTIRIENIWLKPLYIISFTSMLFHQFAIPTGSSLINNINSIVPYIFLIIIFGLIFFKTKFKDYKSLYIIGFGIPIFLFFLVVFFHFPFHYRFLLMFAFPLYILLSVAVVNSKKYFIIFLLIITMFQLFFFISYFHNVNNELQSISEYLNSHNVCPANILHESQFSLIPAMVYNPTCNHYLITNLTIRQGNNKGFDVISLNKINNNTTIYDYYFQSQFNYRLGKTVLIEEGISLVEVNNARNSSN